MRGIRAVRFDRDSLDVLLNMDDDVVRLRVLEDDCDRLGLTTGRQVSMGIEDGGMHPALVTGVEPEPPFAWVAVEFPARSRPD